MVASEQFVEKKLFIREKVQLDGRLRCVNRQTTYGEKRDLKFEYTLFVDKQKIIGRRFAFFSIGLFDG